MQIHKQFKYNHHHDECVVGSVVLVHLVDAYLNIYGRKKKKRILQTISVEEKKKKAKGVGACSLRRWALGRGEAGRLTHGAQPGGGGLGGEQARLHVPEEALQGVADVVHLVHALPQADAARVAAERLAQRRHA